MFNSSNCLYCGTTYCPTNLNRTCLHSADAHLLSVSYIHLDLLTTLLGLFHQILPRFDWLDRKLQVDFGIMEASASRSTSTNPLTVLWRSVVALVDAVTCFLVPMCQYRFRNTDSLGSCRVEGSFLCWDCAAENNCQPPTGVKITDWVASRERSLVVRVVDL